jgi:hypothetical protein
VVPSSRIVGQQQRVFEQFDHLAALFGGIQNWPGMYGPLGLTLG